MAYFCDTQLTHEFLYRPKYSVSFSNILKDTIIVYQEFNNFLLRQPSKNSYAQFP